MVAPGDVVRLTDGTIVMAVRGDCRRSKMLTSEADAFLDAGGRRYRGRLAVEALQRSVPATEAEAAPLLRGIRRFSERLAMLGGR